MEDISCQLVKSFLEKRYVSEFVQEVAKCSFHEFHAMHICEAQNDLFPQVCQCIQLNSCKRVLQITITEAAMVVTHLQVLDGVSLY